MITAEEIVYLYNSRNQALGPEFTQMRKVQAVMNNEIALPLPEIQQDEEPSVANLAQQGMQQLSRRIASVPPTYNWPSIDPGAKQADERAKNRARITTGWWHDNKMKRRLGHRSRFFLAYACAPVLIMPNTKEEIPRWVVKNPLHTFPGEDAFDDHTPTDCIFATTHSYGGLKTMFPEAAEAVTKPDGWDWENDYNNHEVEFEMLEYWDDEEFVLVLVGQNRTQPYQIPTPTNLIGPVHHVIERHPNLAQICPVVIPGSINLDKQLGHFDGIMGMYQAQAALMALTIVGQRRTVWPREWLVANPNEIPEVVTVPDPGTGTPGVIKGGALQSQNLDPSFSTLETIDRLEHAQRQTASLPSEFGGMSQSDNVRTGRRGQQIMSATIDYTIAEAQDTFAESLVEENKRAIAIDKAYFNTKKTYFFATRSYSGAVKYKPSETWETDKHVVDYPIAGSDMQNLPIEGGQRVAMQTLSRKRFMEVDPMVPDPDAEIQQMHREGVEVAFLASIQEQAAMPDGPYQPIHLARLNRKLAEGQNIYEAVEELQKEIQKEQAEMAPAPPQEQPGLSPPGQGVEQMGPMPEMDPSMGNLTQLLGSLGVAQTAGAHRQG